MLGFGRLQTNQAGAGSARNLYCRSLLAAVMLTGLSFPVTSARAQDAVAQTHAAPSGRVAPACEVQPYSPSAEAGVAERNETAARPATLLAVCQGAGVVLGEMDRYQVFTHRGTGALVVEIERMGRIRVMLLQRDEDGQLAVENISGDLAVVAGRTPTGGLRGVAADYTGFADGGVIVVTDEASGEQAAARGAIARPSFSLLEHNRGRQAIMAAARAASVEEAQ